MEKLKTILRAYRNHVITIELFDDPLMGPPWVEHDGHGVIVSPTEAARRIRTGSDCRRLSQKHYYDFTASLGRADAEGWGLGPEQVRVLVDNLWRIPTQAEITREAVNHDFAFCRDFATGKRQWIFREYSITTPTDAVISGESVGGLDDEGYAITEALDTAHGQIDKIIKAAQ